jgi:hypothetical protein
MSAYYYAFRNRIELRGDEEHVAVDRPAAKRAGLDPPLPESSNLAGPGASVIVALKNALAPDALEALRRAGALQPVYRFERALVVALPEVRVEFDGAEQRQAVLRLLAEGKLPQHTLSENSDDRIVLVPLSGRGDDALSIANEIYERAHPASSSPRLLQVVPKPAARG